MLKALLIWLAQKLYPDGRAYRMLTSGSTIVYVGEDGDDEYVSEDGSESFIAEDQPNQGGALYRLHRALNVNFELAWNDANQILNDLLPDNDLFTIEDAHDWYRRLGIYDSGLVSLADMKLAIGQKLSFPLTPLNKQHYLFVEEQLQAAGFDVHVYENRFSDGMGGYVTRTPDDILGSASGAAAMGSFNLGGSNLGEVFFGTKIVSYLEEDKDSLFNIGSNYKSTFFIAGATIDAFASIPSARKTEFRQLLLKYKRCETCGFLFVNYI